MLLFIIHNNKLFQVTKVNFFLISIENECCFLSLEKSEIPYSVRIG